MTPTLDSPSANGPATSIPWPKHEAQTHGPDQRTNSPVGDRPASTDRKRKGKSSMARHGSTSATQSPNLSHSRRPPPAPASSLPMSRKRSRSGTRVPNGVKTPPDEEERERNRQLLEEYTARDELDTNLLQAQTGKRDALLKSMNNEIQVWRELRASAPQDPGRIYGEGFKGYGNSWTAQYPTKVIYPLHRKRPAGRRAPELRVNRKDRAVQAEQIEELVPIRLDLETEKLRLRDTFTWNMFDRTVRTDVFAEGLIEDLKVPPDAVPALTAQVIQALQEQVQDFHPHPFMEDNPLEPNLPFTAYKDEEIRIPIKINITIGQHNLIDQFDWDINNRHNSPEEFATCMATDLSLSGEFMTAIVHSIREQTQMFTRSLYITGHPFDGRTVEDAELRDNILTSPVPSSFRPFSSVKDYTPLFYELTDADIERAELAFSREQRQQKRSVNRRGGPTMPDLKERPRTVRTLVVSSVIPGAADSLDHSVIYKPTRTQSGRGRRPYKADGADSDDSESESSDADSPVRAPPAAAATPAPIIGGTARTRGIRGAASAAQAAMRATLAGSMTPETQHELQATVRSHGRRGGYEIREGSATEPAAFLLRLKMPRAKYRIWWRNYKEIMRQRVAAQQAQQLELQRIQAVNLQQAHIEEQRRQASLPPSQAGFGTGRGLSRGGTPVQGGGGAMPPPPSTPGLQMKTEDGMQGTPGPPRPQQPPPPHQAQPLTTTNPPGPPPLPPHWLATALTQLRHDLPSDSFAPFMRWNPAERVWQPRIRCNDCPGTLYNTSEADPVGNFRVHLGNKGHRERVERRGGA